MNRDVAPPYLQLMVALNVSLNISERLRLSNAIFTQKPSYNSTYSLKSLQINMNPEKPDTRKKGKNSSSNIIECAFFQWRVFLVFSPFVENVTLQEEVFVIWTTPVVIAFEIIPAIYVVILILKHRYNLAHKKPIGQSLSLLLVP